jgi:hypothetical protein
MFDVSTLNPRIMVPPDQPEEIREGILSALRQKPGLVPGSLNRFSRVSFGRRCAAIFEEVLGKTSASETGLDQPVRCG